MSNDTNTTNSAAFATRHRELAESMAGFTGLIQAMQGLLVGDSLATGEVWVTNDVETTLTIIHRTLTDLNEMTQAWGYQA
jgi:hypothetical protein